MRLIYHLQCDETRPQCNKCINYGVTCNYDGIATEELQLPGEGAFSFTSKPNEIIFRGEKEIPKDSMSPEANDDKIDSMLDMPMELHESDETYHISKEDLEILRIFKDQTVFTIGTAQTVHIYRSECVNMLCHSVSPHIRYD